MARLKSVAPITQIESLLGDIILPWPPAALNPNTRIHWAAKRPVTAKAKLDGFYATKAAKPVLDTTKLIHLYAYFYAPDKRHRDDDNLLSALKPYRDGIADALGINDRLFRSTPILMLETQPGGCVVVRLAN